MEIKDSRIKYFGTKVNKEIISKKINRIKQDLIKFRFYLIIAGTHTALIDGISGAGIDSESRKITPLADAEFLLFGPSKKLRYKLPFLNAGVSPAVISYVCAKLLGADFTVIPIGVHQKPYFKHFSVENKFDNPANCTSCGRTMDKKRVENLYKKGLTLGLTVKNPIFISESVPGGTTTAQAIMEAFGLKVSELIGSSLLKPPRELKKEIVTKGIINSNLEKSFDSIDVLAALGDPFQAFTIGLLIGAREAKQTVILSGGSQMIAILLLALEYIKLDDKQNFVEQIFIVTTGWLAKDKLLSQLLELVANKHDVSLYGFASCLNFNSSTLKELRDYEKGYVKEGVGAGGMAFLAYLKGFNDKEIVLECENSVKRMKKNGQILSPS